MDRRYLLALLLCACSPAVPSQEAGTDAAAEATAADVQLTENVGAETGPDAGAEASACGTGLTYCPAHGPDSGWEGFDAGCTNVQTDPLNCGQCGVICDGVESCVVGVNGPRCCRRGAPGCS